MQPASSASFSKKVAVMVINVPFTRNSPSELGSPR
jgi:hypothetical protein